ncbi:hypothetical protein [Mycobacterium simiae]|uniref:hypothetical protein n=1 Tax=Mycobacterium simiae TaxID=1784 RepID=UPI00159447A0|nr:hypothetical protein [Mycobacterium simiae]
MIDYTDPTLLTTVYAAAKAGLNALSAAAALEHAPDRGGTGEPPRRDDGGVSG